jgi:hypothetical protein
LKPLGKKWPARGAVSARLGTPLTMEPGEEPQSFAKRLEAAVAALQATGDSTGSLSRETSNRNRWR